MSDLAPLTSMSDLAPLTSMSDLALPDPETRTPTPKGIDRPDLLDLIEVPTDDVEVPLDDVEGSPDGVDR